MRSRKSGGKAKATPQELARTAALLALEKKAADVVVLDLRKFSLGCDCFLIASGTSDPHVRAIAAWVEERLHEQYGEVPWHREGLAAARWILLDYVDLVVHVLRTEARENYMLERLWGDAPIERFDAEGGMTEKAAGTGNDR